MKIDQGTLLKARWMGMPPSWFEPLTFEELEVGQRFITLPSPGDNQGHGGLKGSHYIFSKTHKEIAEAAPGLPYGLPHGRALNEQRQLPTDFPHSTLVVLVE